MEVDYFNWGSVDPIGPGCNALHPHLISHRQGRLHIMHINGNPQMNDRGTRNPRVMTEGYRRVGVGVCEAVPLAYPYP